MGGEGENEGCLVRTGGYPLTGQSGEEVTPSIATEISSHTGCTYSHFTPVSFLLDAVLLLRHCQRRRERHERHGITLVHFVAWEAVGSVEGVE